MEYRMMVTFTARSSSRETIAVEMEEVLDAFQAVRRVELEPVGEAEAREDLRLLGRAERFQFLRPLPSRLGTACTSSARCLRTPAFSSCWRERWRTEGPLQRAFDASHAVETRAQLAVLGFCGASRGSPL